MPLAYNRDMPTLKNRTLFVLATCAPLPLESNMTPRIVKPKSCALVGNVRDESTDTARQTRWGQARMPGESRGHRAFAQLGELEESRS